MSLWICPTCGKQNSILHYDPTNFVDDIIIIRLRGLGKGKGFDEIERYSLLDGSDPELLDLISDRVAVIYDMLQAEPDEADHSVDHEDEEEEDEVDFESLSELDKQIFLAEQEEEDEEEDEDINDLDEEIIE